ncbi:Uncharacterised protein [Mycobacteroides abscessus]|nr:Uncharacterised protein [Mycobacteroides abscessus]
MARPTIDARVDSPRSATSATVRMPYTRSFSAVTDPTPHSACTGSGRRNDNSSCGSTTSSPSDLPWRLATLAKNLVRAMPTVIGSPARRRTSTRNAAAISLGAPEIRSRPDTSRNASSMDSGSTRGVVSRKTSNTNLLAAL